MPCKHELDSSSHCTYCGEFFPIVNVMKTTDEILAEHFSHSNQSIDTCKEDLCSYYVRVQAAKKKTILERHQQHSDQPIEKCSYSSCLRNLQAIEAAIQKGKS